MKKKTIEKIPFLGLPKLARAKRVKYIGMTALKEVGNENLFFLEVYQNDKGHKDIPVVRIALSQNIFRILVYGPGKDAQEIVGMG